MINIESLNVDTIVLLKHFRKHYRALMRTVYNRPELAESPRWNLAFDKSWYSCDDNGVDYFVCSDFIVNLLYSRGVDVFSTNRDMPAHNAIFPGIFKDEHLFYRLMLTRDIVRSMTEANLLHLFRSLASFFHVHSLHVDGVTTVREMFLSDNPTPEEIERFDAGCLNCYYQSFAIHQALELCMQIEGYFADGFMDMAPKRLRTSMGAIRTKGWEIRRNDFYAISGRNSMAQATPLMIYFILVHDQAAKEWEQAREFNPVSEAEKNAASLLCEWYGGGSENRMDPENASPPVNWPFVSELQVAYLNVAMCVGDYLSELE